jgi:hypothetical protein
MYKTKHLHHFLPHYHHTSIVMKCQKCQIIVYKSRAIALKELNRRIAHDKESWSTKNINTSLSDSDKNDFKNSLKYYISIGNDIYFNNDNVSVHLNHKGQVIKKIYCKLSDDDFLVKDIIK